MKERLKLNRFSKKQLELIGIIILLLAVPLILILINRVQNYKGSAAAPDKLETEAGTLSSSGVSKQSDTGASGGQYVVFNQSNAPTPTIPPITNSYLKNCTALDKNKWASRIFPPPSLSMPGYLQSTTDPTTGVKITRVTGDPGTAIPNITGQTWRTICGPTYPKVPAWNADQSVLFMQNTCVSGFLLLDAKDGPNQYKVLFRRSAGHEGRWHPKDPNTLFYADVNNKRIGSMNINTGATNVIYIAPESNFTECDFGNHEGAISDNGKYTVMFCEDSSLPAHNSTRPGISFFVVNLENGTRASPVITSWEMPNFEFLDSAVISPSGKYIVAQQNSSKSITLGYSQNDWWQMHLGSYWGLGHFDVGYDGLGNEIAFEAEGEMVNLATGIKTTWLNVNYSQYHTSNRNLQIPGWGFANNVRSSGLTPVYDGEIIAAETKPNGLIRRIVHHRSTGSTSSGSERYDALPMATSSPDGTRVFYRSDWGNAGGAVYGFVADIRNVCGQ